MGLTKQQLIEEGEFDTPDEATMSWEEWGKLEDKRQREARAKHPLFPFAF